MKISSRYRCRSGRGRHERPARRGARLRCPGADGVSHELQYCRQYLYCSSATCLGCNGYGCGDSKRRRGVATIAGSGIGATIYPAGIGSAHAEYEAVMTRTQHLAVSKLWFGTRLRQPGSNSSPTTVAVWRCDFVRQGGNDRGMN
jgi:hypothetical protein